MRKVLSGLVIGAVLLCGLAANTLAQDGSAAKWTRVPIGTPVVVTPGQEFYAEADSRPTRGVRIDQPFKSSMPGAMGFPFAFAIDSDVLIHVYTSPSGWDYFVPPDHKFRAWHSLLGSVLRNGDTVGVRLGPAGQVEWFVDNSRYAGRSALWTRPARSGDPGVKPAEVTLANAGYRERLIYLGMSSTRRVKIRLETTTPGKVRRDEFAFTVDQDGKGAGAIDGAEFTIEATPTQALITVVKAMASDRGEPVEPSKDPVSPSSPTT